MLVYRFHAILKTMVRRQRRKKKRAQKEVRWKVLVGLLIVILGGWWLVEKQTSSLKGDKGRLNLVFAGDQKGAVVMSIDQVTKKIDWLYLPAESLIPAKSLGYYQVGKLVALGRYEKNPDQFIVSRIQSLIKLPIRGFCWVGDNLDLDQDPKHSWWWRCQKSNLNLSDKLRLSYWYQSYLSYQWRLDDWQKEGVIKKEGGEWYYDESRLNEIIRKKLFDWGVAQEGLEVAVVDQSGQDLGHDFSSLVDNLGAHVVINRLGKGRRRETLILVKNQEVAKSLTVQRLKAVTHTKKVEIQDVSRYRSDVVVILGSDLGQWFF